MESEGKQLVTEVPLAQADIKKLRDERFALDNERRKVVDEQQVDLITEKYALMVLKGTRENQTAN